jgi:hypothetical protein
MLLVSQLTPDGSVSWLYIGESPFDRWWGSNLGWIEFRREGGKQGNTPEPGNC